MGNFIVKEFIQSTSFNSVFLICNIPSMLDQSLKNGTRTSNKLAD